MLVSDYFIIASIVLLVLHLLWRYVGLLDPDKDFPYAKVMSIDLSQCKFVLKCKVQVSHLHGQYLKSVIHDELMFTDDPAKALKMSEYLANKFLTATGHTDILEMVPSP